MSLPEQTVITRFRDVNLRVFRRRNGQLDIDGDGKDGRISLKIAARNGDIRLVQHLLWIMEGAKASGPSILSLMISAPEYQTIFTSLVPSEEPSRTEVLASVTGRTPLSCAAEMGHTAVVHILLERGEDVNEKDTSGTQKAPIYWAADHGHAETVVVLLQQEANVEALDANGDTPLCLAVQTRKGLTPSSDLINIRAPGKQEVNGCKMIMNYLIQKGSNIEARTGSIGLTPLMLAIFSSCIDALELLLQYGADFEAQDSAGRTTLVLAVAFGNLNMVKLLLDHNAKPDHLDQTHWTPLNYAMLPDSSLLPVVAIPNKTRIVELLLESRPRLLVRRDKCQQTCIGAAIPYGNCEMVKLLLDYPGSDVRQGVLSMPLLCYAAYSGKDAVVNLLIEQGVSLQGTDGRYGRHALSWATCSNKKAAFMRSMSTPGIGWDDVDQVGRNALFYAAARGCINMFEQLRSRGSHVYCRDRFGLTPLFVAIQRGDRRLVSLILLNRPLRHEPRDRFGRGITWWMHSTGNTWMRALLLKYGMQLDDDGQGEHSHPQLKSNKFPNSCDVCTLRLARDNRGIECGSGCRKYRICHICCQFGANCEDFGENSRFQGDVPIYPPGSSVAYTVRP
ncbi:ankyrin repeat-containing domain protein [Aspergillus novoparasiticus]|uniref:Ankyrin repeat-containing domain protein n=1 Tax=Aspergillus novoparasiticus TaxID=986946 RepID=A0A5N6F8P6_9EURO|nr:ankyrin repeat-containing domain protein [Aspergillus novoparasiticus]